MHWAIVVLLAFIHTPAAFILAAIFTLLEHYGTDR